MNLKLKGLLVERFGSQTAAARALGLSESRLSRVIRGWESLRVEEVEIFSRIFGKRATAEFLKNSVRPEAR